MGGARGEGGHGGCIAPDKRNILKMIFPDFSIKTYVVGLH